MATRKSKTAEPIIDVQYAQSVKSEELQFEELMREATRGTLLDDSISSKRKLVSFIASILTSFGVGYTGGYLTGLLMIGVLSMTTSMFLFWAAAVIGVLLSVYAGAKLGGYVGNYILSSQIDKDLAKVGNVVKGWFTSNKEVAA